MDINVEQLCNEVQEHLDFDPRYWDQEEGMFFWSGHAVFYERRPDWFVIEVPALDLEVTCARP